MDTENNVSEGLLDNQGTRRTTIGRSTFYDESSKDRLNAFGRAVYGEFMGTFLFLLPILGACANAYQLGWTQSETNIILALITGFHAIAMILCFSSLSGSQLNPAISFALWITGRISNRKFIAFVIAQFAASIAVMLCIYGSFPKVDHDFLRAIAVTPPSGTTLGNIFFTEFLMSYLLTYVAFAMAFEEAFEQANNRSSTTLKQLQEKEGVIVYSSNPQSKAGFAPFALGFCLIGICFYGGGSGVALNPARMFGPAIFASQWDRFYIYWLGQFLGAGFAAVLVTYGPQSSRPNKPHLQDLVEVIPNEVKQTLNYLSAGAFSPHAST